MERAQSGAAPAWPERKPPTCTANYGGADFSAILLDNQFYVDQTAHLAKLDGIERAVLLRPPRWGKTLWLSMLECYYGVAHKERFGELFGGLDIVRRAKELQPDTSLQSSFHVLRVELPAICTADPKDYAWHFGSGVKDACTAMLESLPDQQREDWPELPENDASRCITRMADFVNNKLKGKLMVLVDEVDRAPMNTLARQGKKAYEMVCDPLLSFLSALKNVTSDTPNKCFLVGIAPVALHGMSVWNVATSLHHKLDFAQVLGMTEPDVERALREVAGLRGTPELEAEHAEAMELARTWYNKHYFNYGQQVGLYNPQQVLYFVSKYAMLREYVKNPAAATAKKMDLVDPNQAGLSESQRRLVMQSNALTKSLLPLAWGE